MASAEHPATTTTRTLHTESLQLLTHFHRPEGGYLWRVFIHVGSGALSETKDSQEERTFFALLLDQRFPGSPWGDAGKMLAFLFSKAPQAPRLSILKLLFRCVVLLPTMSWQIINGKHNDLD